MAKYCSQDQVEMYTDLLQRTFDIQVIHYTVYSWDYVHCPHGIVYGIIRIMYCTKVIIYSVQLGLHTRGILNCSGLDLTEGIMFCAGDTLLNLSYYKNSAIPATKIKCTQKCTPFTSQKPVSK